MILTGKEIQKRIGKDIIITPYSEKQLNPNSYNLRLHEELLIYTELPLDMKKPNLTKKQIIPESGLLLKPGILYLGRTLEFTETHHLVPMLEGRSSIGRLGMLVHVTAGFGDVGFKGFWTLEISVIQPLIVYPGVEVCQIFYHTLEGQITEYTSGKYQANQGIQPSMLYQDFEK
ncbi:dCTP deaminase [Leptospira borgpetersenii]|uniref:dCTP deaminase, dUMP-forming n=3 Tax=Leptospira borgpetersenii serovar Hardjo-bovis TaxID=338217 RepID=DCDB_LEPBJ|nr:dCTP deaminase [Leptospira borgpetersenii]Q04WA6.1 RecName: Full=dCTP deaminase, dUMP-forming; AltName: Full=Bifunctional dCTP deaminase:dUTPase; AltName: Full=DCD-DUT [Leptospira borgpetersenii serovar Hardjo-bovis str. JB197]Q04X69.1 RecName: Full=dCTP deaminase, dUMP-forming; AltName: Full=Bifunctional dCTP deaminase:dUTPase; AltName: Full=DCD-DUT [Leptospira borgpetersenii serovar Hardjo-bovis str. L550]ABJ74814.1 dCTP deaminase [Leptospira borgpetersenii serovar Hardjo-bovis str. JB197]